MSAPRLSPPADLVRQHDPDLFHAALFAPEPGRERLMVLYAFDIELSRAAARSSEPMIARMRLQWWRDVLAEARAGAPVRRHEVAEPLHGLLAEGLPDGADGELEALIAARELELEGPFDRAAYQVWADGRFGGLVRLAALILSGADGAAARAATAAGQALAAAFVLRQSIRLAAEANVFLLPDLAAGDRAGIARGRVSEAAAGAAQSLATEARMLLRAARGTHPRVPRAALPALLPVGPAERVLRKGRLMYPHEATPAGRGPMIFWRALRGRW